MAESYSIGSIVGRVDSPQVPKTVKLPNEYVPLGAQYNAASTGQPILCQMPDGSQKWMKLVPERSNIAIGDLVFTPA